MNLFQRFAARVFGFQYVMVRAERSLVFTPRRAYRIAGRWYIRRDWSYNMAEQGPKKSFYKGKSYYMLTKSALVTKFEEQQTTDYIVVHDIWLPITDLLTAEFVVRPH